MSRDPRRSLPRTDALLADGRLAPWPRDLARDAVRETLAEVRRAVGEGAAVPDDLAADAVARLTAWTTPRLVPVINATGVVLHTNLGRAPWSPDAVAAAARVTRGYTDLELRRGDGRRGGRLDGVRERLVRLTGAEDAVVVNNGAAAVLLALTALAHGRDVLVSRGQLVEIGGSFRVPDVVAAGGAHLVEVGTTNRTRGADFRRAAGPDTAMLLEVHPSNFRQEGFVETVPHAELVALGAELDVPVVYDLGGGSLDGTAAEPSVRAAVEVGFDLVAFSGDKLLGGPQAGILVGRAAAVAACRRHPMYRALRLDKAVLAALDATLCGWLAGRRPPAVARLEAPVDALRPRAEAVAAALTALGWAAEVVASQGLAGGGTQATAPSVAVAVGHDDVDALATRLRTGTPAVVARVHDGRVWLDLRAVDPDEDQALVTALDRARAGE